MEQAQVSPQSPPPAVSLTSPTESGKASTKPPVVRGARACTVCRTAKMKCVGAEDGQPCQRCKRSGSDCVFEKHRRGRKPGSKLSEASKMLRRLEKGLNTAKLKSRNDESITLPFPPDTRSGDRFPNNELPPLNLPPDYDNKFPTIGNGPRSSHDDEDTDDPEKPGDLFPAELIQKERNSSFFKTILNPTPCEPTSSRAVSERSSTLASPRTRTPILPPSHPPPSTVVTVPGLNDPIAAGLIDESRAAVLFDLFYLRLNPFINLFDPQLHTVSYIRSRCPFLFTTIIMGCCKFFEMDLYKQVQQLAHQFAVRAFADNWKRVEVCQAFACLTYWKEPEDTRTWTYVGYACRMAVELGLNRYVGKRPPEETNRQMLERRNRERTYLVIFVHDRSLSTQTGRQWMLPECELVRHSTTWHEEGDTPIRPEDVILAAFVQLRLIASETTEVFYSHRGVAGANHADMNHDVLLKNCNGKLTQWSENWEHEMQRANGDKFHFAFLSFFRLYVRLFLNSFGIQAYMSPTNRSSPSLHALSACYSSALEVLQIVTKEFAAMSMLRYGQDSITVMTAYSAVFLLKLLRSSNTLAELYEGATDEIYTHISQVAEAYHEASLLSPSSTAAAHHARFLRHLVAHDRPRAKQHEKDRYQQQQQGLRASDSRAQPSYPTYSQPSHNHSPPSVHPQPMMQSQLEEHNFHFPASPTVPSPPLNHGSTPFAARSHGHAAMRDTEYASTSVTTMRNGSMSGYPAYAAHAPLSQPPQGPSQVYGTTHSLSTSESDANYWRNMFRELGYGDPGDSAYSAVNGFATTMPDGGAFGVTTSGTIGYHDIPVNGHHVGYPGHSTQASHSSRQYQPYPTPSYNSHPSQSGYSTLVGR